MYTLVQHSGYTVGGKPEFRKAVEAIGGVSAREAEKIRAIGGLVFTDYENATTAEEAENYPPEVAGFIPTVRGKFSDHKVRGARIYVPKED